MRNKGYTDWKGKMNYFIFAYDITIYIKYLKNHKKCTISIEFNEYTDRYK